jgi:phosphoadenosine phosphosulfate reductase
MPATSLDESRTADPGVNGMAALYHAIQTAATVSLRVLVGYSGGKDSAVLLDLCTKYFDQVEVFFMYLVRGLGFQEATLRHAEARYGVKIHRVPHFMLSELLRYGTYRIEDFETPIVSTRQVYDYLREQAGCRWIACGERIADSTVRRAQIKRSGSIDPQRGRFFPLAEWNKADVLAYIRQHGLYVGAESEKLGFSFRGLGGEDMAKIKAAYPADYERIQRWFPLVEGAVRRYEQCGK